MKTTLIRSAAGLLAVLSLAWPCVAQTFNSGSTGVDGALNLTTAGTVVFDPKTFNPPLDADGDGVYHFTTITVGAGVTVRLGGDIINQPVVWLAQGAVQINGTIDASGQHGFSASNTTQRTLTVPGAGGYAGGAPGIGLNGPTAGLGPFGGVFPCANGIVSGQNGGSSANQFAVPLIGGSGGGAAGTNAGGAGGGAILIASSTSIAGAGSISVRGGDGRPNNHSGAGGGGALRLVAPSVTLSGRLDAAAGTWQDSRAECNPHPRAGVVRVEAFQIGALNNDPGGRLYTASPYSLHLSPSAAPSVRVVSVGGASVATSPTGTFTLPDVTVNSNAPLPVAIQAANVPIGTIVTLRIFSENGPDQTIQSTPLTGTLAQSTATANVTLPSGFSRGFLNATFTQP